jgi:hypothetical protein
VYRVSFIASDGRGCESAGSVVIDVPADIINGTDSAVDDGQSYDATAIN